MAEDWQAVGRTVTRLRAEHGWTQPKLFEHSGVSIATIRNTEKGIGKRGRRTLEDLSKAFGKPRNYLSEILDGHQPPEIAEGAATELASPDVLDMLDGLLVRRLTEIVVPHLNQIEHRLHAHPDVAYGSSRSPGVDVGPIHGKHDS